MATVSARLTPQQEAELKGAPRSAPTSATTLDWGNSAPLALLAFAGHDVHAEHGQRGRDPRGRAACGVRRRADVRRRWRS